MGNGSDNNGSDGHIEQYTSYIQDLGNIGMRHENARKYYLSVVSALFVFLSLAGKEGVIQSIKGPLLPLIGACGIALSVAWMLHMQAFGAIFKAKFDVLRKMEKEYCLYHIYDEEFQLLQKDPRFFFLTVIDLGTPILLIFLFGFLMYFKVSG